MLNQFEIIKRNFKPNVDNHVPNIRLTECAALSNKAELDRLKCTHLATKPTQYSPKHPV